MKTRWIAIASAAVCITACDSPQKPVEPRAEAKPAPAAFFLLEAESLEIPDNGEDSARIAGDPGASGSESVELKSGSPKVQLVFKCPASKRGFDAWIRCKGGSVAMGYPVVSPMTADDSGDHYVWINAGKFGPSGDGGEMVLFANDDKNPYVAVDCILLTEGSIEDKDSLLTPLPPVSIDTTNTVGGFRSAPRLWGVNLDPGGSPGQAYLDTTSYLSPKMVRIRTSGKPDGSGVRGYDFLDPNTKTWDEQKVRAAISAILAMESVAEIMINVPNWPGWMDAESDGFLDEDKVTEYAALAGRFAEIVWEFPAARERVLFEISSGHDFLYYSDLAAAGKPHRISELARIFLTCAERIREVAPGARIGAPSVAEPFATEFHEQFVALTAPRLDFYSMSFYASGNPRDSDSRILAFADSVLQPLQSVRDILKLNAKDREIPVSVSEYNISWNEEPAEPRMRNGFGAVWDAWFMMGLFSAGADSAAARSEAGEIYGKVSPAGERRPASHIYHVLNTEFSGPVARLETEEQEEIAALATEPGNRILICHRGLRDRKILLPPGKWSGWLVGKNIDVPRPMEMEGQGTLPGISALYLKKE